MTEVKRAEPILLVLNGPAGVGKTAAATRLAGALPSSAHVRGDDLKRFVVSKPSTVRSGVTYRNGALVCSELLASGYGFVVFDFVFSRKEQLDDFWAHVDPAVPFAGRFVTLWANDQTLSRRRSGRSEDPEVRGLMDSSRARLAESLDELQPVIHTDELSGAEVALRIVREILAGAGMDASP